MVRQMASMNGLLLVGLAVLAVAAPRSKTAIACDTPVYRYAMYRWSPTPYELYYFHEDYWQEQKYNEKDLEIHNAIQRMVADPVKPANVVLLPVNTFADPQLRSVPPDVRRHWEKQEDKSLPQYMLISPKGARVFSGDLRVDQLDSLVFSPTRRRIADLLGEGRSGVFLLLGGNDSALNDAAEKVLHDLAADVRAGKIDLYKGPKPAFGNPVAPAQEPKTIDQKTNVREAAEEDESAKSPPPRQIGVVRLERNDPREHWLIETLLTVEPDLKDEEFEDEPMVFVVYGRARALPPYIGKGITRTNMLDVLNFITSACSCTVKEQNPGVDLLARYDWETAATKLADRFGTEEGNEGFYAPDEFFPELIVGSGGQADKQPDDSPDQESAGVASVEPVATEKPDRIETSNEKEAENFDSGGSQHAGINQPTKNATKLASPNSDRDESDVNGTDVSDAQVASLTTNQNKSSDASNASNHENGTTNSWMYTLAIGVGIGLVVLVGASFVFLKNR